MPQPRSRGPRAVGAFVALAALIALAPRAGRAQGEPMQGELSVTVQYPPAGAAITATDSTFVFGRVEGAGGGAVALTVNGAPVPVHAGGGWIAFVPLEPDSFTFEVAAVSGGRRAETRRTVWVPRSLLEPPTGDTLGYRPETIQPRGPLELYAGDTVQVSVVASPDMEIRARLGDASVLLLPELPDVSNAGRLVFDFGELPETHWTAEPPEAPDGPWKRFAGDLYLTYSGDAGDSLRLEFTRPGRATRTAAATAISFLDPTVVRTAALDDDTAGTGRTDHRVIARHGPGMGYYLFLPNGTRAPTGRRSGDWRELALGPGTRAWAPLAETFPIPAARPGSRVTVIRSRLEDGWSEIVVPTTDRLPFRIVQELDPVRYTVRVFGAAADVDYVHREFDDRAAGVGRLGPARDRRPRDRGRAGGGARMGVSRVLGRLPPGDRLPPSAARPLRPTLPLAAPRRARDRRPGTQSRPGCGRAHGARGARGEPRDLARACADPRAAGSGGRPDPGVRRIRRWGSTTGPTWRSPPAAISSCRSTTTRSPTA